MRPDFFFQEVIIDVKYTLLKVLTIHYYNMYQDT